MKAERLFINARATINETMDEQARFCMFIHFPWYRVMLCITWPRFTLTPVMWESTEGAKCFFVPIAWEIPKLCLRMLRDHSISAQTDLEAAFGASLKDLAEKHALRLVREREEMEGDDIALAEA